MRVAIVHYWLVTMRGGENVVERLCRLFPQADIYTHLYDPSAISDYLNTRTIKTTFIQKLPFASRIGQKYLPLMPLALEELDLSGYDLIISSESGPAKGIIPPPDATHLCYCHSPMRYLWDQYHIYKRSSGMLTRAMLPFLAHGMRQWDVTSSARVDCFAANSAFVAQRIEKYYRRTAEIIHPPVETSAFSPLKEQGDYFLWVGQFVPYKACSVAIEAFNRLKLPLVVVGAGPEQARLKAIAAENVKFVPPLPRAELARTYAQARALVFTAKEDFGIVPVEAQASGRPVIAFGAGGALETVKSKVTGLFYDRQTAEALIEAVEAFELWHADFDPEAAVLHARSFSAERFDASFAAFAQNAIRAGKSRDSNPANARLDLDIPLKLGASRASAHEKQHSMTDVHAK